ncbi:CidA/LrgA family protein [Sansalvadorimonas verongulae]|uniref:CidA/LrgA family protein n=1 Tax=Sansalvadorimonas verongulae TaxID=2172824 RepID=UPI0012BCAC2C|nr:CidA/LrgA family protein [Sansalvadorimonas verongulae]MTI14060.1 CidA/LrgA family protein [Sansalvadorimonas verongulae]
MRGLFVLLLFQCLGEALHRFGHIALPGPVLGMLILFVALCIYKAVPDSLAESSNNLIGVMSIMLIPAVTGFCFYLLDIGDQLVPILAATVFGTIIAIVFTALLMARLIKEEHKSLDDTHE